MTCPLSRPLLFLAFSAFICAAQEPPEKACARAVVPFYRYEKTLSEGLPAGYFDRGDTIEIISAEIDSTGNPWFVTKSPDSVKVSTPAGKWRYMSSSQKQSAGMSGFADKEDRIRRIKILRNHREWPRRIIRAVREGSICLDMTREHVAASWGEPLQEGGSFMLGVGEHRAMFFRSGNCGISAVYLVNGKVTGWSSCRQEKKQ